MFLERNTEIPPPAPADQLLPGAGVVAGVACTAVAASEMILQRGTGYGDGRWAFVIGVAVMAGCVLWGFGALALVMSGSRFSRAITLATLLAGGGGMLCGAIALLSASEALWLAGAGAVMGGAVLAGSGMLARALAPRGPGG